MGLNTVGLLQASDERSQPTERTGFKAVADARTVDLSADETRILENLEVLRDRRLRERQLVDDVPADAGIRPGQESEDLHAGWMPNRLAEGRELLVGLLALDGPEIGLSWVA